MLDALDSSVDIYCCDAKSAGKQYTELEVFLSRGGGLIIAGQAWNWAHHNPGEDVLTGYKGNDVTGLAGIFITGRYNRLKELRYPGPHIPLTVSVKP